MSGYVEGPTVAHVMEYQNNGIHESVCYNQFAQHWGVRLNAADWRDRGDEWPLHWANADAQPSKPWCRRCLRILTNRAAQLERTVLRPAGVGQLAAVHALIARYRQVSDSPTQAIYLRDLERIFDPSLPPVVDADGRSKW